MKFLDASFKMLSNNLQKHGRMNALLTGLIFGYLIAGANVNIMASEKIEEPKPLKRPYKTMVDYAVFINNEQEPKGQGALRNTLFVTLRACQGMTEEGYFPKYKQFVVIATMPVVSSLFEHTDPYSHELDWKDLVKDLKNNIDTYATDDKSFVVFIPTGYKEDEYKIKFKKTFANKSEQLKYIGFNSETLKPFEINKINPEEDRYKYLPNKAEEIDINQLTLVFTHNDANIARCVYLEGHGQYKQSIAGMNKVTYLQFLQLLEKLDTRFLYISSCYSGGMNAVVMNMALKQDFSDTLSKQKKFDLENIHFPIVVNAVSDMTSASKLLSLKDEQIFFLNNFFITLHPFLTSPTWEIGIKKSKWHKKFGEGPLVLMSDVLKTIYWKTPRLINLPSIYIPDCKEVPGGLFFKAVEVDSMKIITHNNLAPNITIADHVKKRIVTKHGEIKETGLTEEEKIKKTKYILFYPVDMSSTTFQINSELLPKFISKIGGNSYHIIGKLTHKCPDLETITKSFIYPSIISRRSGNFEMGLSHKAWLIKRMESLKDPSQVFDHIIFYKPAATGRDENTKFYNLIMYLAKERYHISKAIIGFTENKDIKYTIDDDTVAPLYYFFLSECILDNCIPDQLALEKFTSKKENLESIKSAADKFLRSAVPSRVIDTNAIKQAEKILLTDDSLPIEQAASLRVLQASSTQNKKEYETTFNSTPLKSQSRLLERIIAHGDKNLIPSSINNETIATQNEYGLPPLHNAIVRKADKDIIELLIKSNPKSLVIQNNDGLPPLHYAISRKADKEIIQLLIKSNPEALVIQNNDGLPPFHYAILQKADKDIIKLLINDKSIIAQDKLGLPPLHYAISRKADKEIIQLLIKSNPESLVIQDKSGLPPLHYAISRKSDKDIIQLLINDKSIIAQDKLGLTPLNFAILIKAGKDIIELLINDKSIIAQNKQGRTPLHIAIREKADKDIIQLLINDKTINLINKLRQTPLQVAIEAGLSQDIIDLLKKHGAKEK